MNLVSELIRQLYYRLQLETNSRIALGWTKPEAYYQHQFPSKWTQFLRSLVGRRLRAIFFTVTILFTVFTWSFLPHPFRNAFSQPTDVFTRNLPPFSIQTSKHSDIGNRTLGFEKIYAIGLPDRFDKRDAIEIAADISNLQLTWVDGVQGNLVHPKSVPPTFKQFPEVLPGVIGCWRSHMNVIRKIVKEKISTALILEDDADWDLRIVSQMQQFATATKALLAQGDQGGNGRRRAPTNSPYGEGWDILWIGHCGGFPGNASSVPHYIIRNDETVPPAIDMDDMLFDYKLINKPDILSDPSNPNPPCAAHAGRDPPGRTCDSPRLSPNERIVQERAKPVCTVSYAISYKGARKMLARLGGLSLEDVIAPIDQGIGDICNGLTDLPGEKTRCFTPSPPYIRGHQPRGPLSGSSDIRNTGANGERREVGFSKGIMWSTRLNANSIISGANFEPEGQYIRDGPKGEEQWRYRGADEYRSFKEQPIVNEWIWH